MTRIVGVLISVVLLSVIFVGTAIASVSGISPSSVSSVVSLGAPQPLSLAATVGGVVGGVQSLPSTSTADVTWSLILLGVIAAARSGIEDGTLVELRLKPRLLANARFAYVTLAGRTEAPAMAYFRNFLRAHLHE